MAADQAGEHVAAGEAELAPDGLLAALVAVEAGLNDGGRDAERVDAGGVPLAVTRFEVCLLVGLASARPARRSTLRTPPLVGPRVRWCCTR